MAVAGSSPSMAFNRRTVMTVLARAEAGELRPAIAGFDADPVEDLRRPETGLVMLRGRIGGGGAPFNFGEATVTRASIRLATGEIGHGWRLGSDGEAARLQAIVDALWQRDPEAVERAIVMQVAARLSAEDESLEAETAATRVNFFTMVRGED